MKHYFLIIDDEFLNDKFEKKYPSSEDKIYAFHNDPKLIGHSCLLSIPKKKKIGE